MGPTPTLPPSQQPPPASHHRRTQRPSPDVDQDLVLDVDQPPATPPALAAEREREGAMALEEAAALHRELAEADPTTRTGEEPEPLGRRLPQPPDAAREGVER